jgi:hypothetical protein
MDHANDDIARALMPSAHTLRERQNLLFQFWRFLALNLRFVTMIFKGEH